MSSEHPGDDALSALLDGEATLEEAAHVEACAGCAARADELRRAANLIGSPVAPVDDEYREAAIAAALGARVVAVDQRRRRAQPPAWLLGAAAVVVLALGLIPLLGRGDNTTDQDTAVGGGQESTLEAPAAEESTAADSTTAFRAATPVDAGDLGAVDGDELQDRVTAALLAPPAAATGETEADPTTTTAAASIPSCEPELRTTDPEAGSLRLTGRATVDGRATQILAFEVPGPEAVLLRVYVVADDDCRDILRMISFPAP